MKLSIVLNATGKDKLLPIKSAKDNSLAKAVINTAFTA